MNNFLALVLLTVLAILGILTFLGLIATPEVAYQQVTVDDDTFVYPGGASDIVLVLESGSYTVNGDLATGCYELTAPKFYEEHGHARLVGAELCEEVEQ